MRSHLPCAAILGALALVAAPGSAAATCDAPLETPADVYALLDDLLAGSPCDDPGPDEAFDAMVDLAMTSCPIGWDCAPRVTPAPGEPVSPPLIPTIAIDPPITTDPPVIATPPIAIVWPLPPGMLPPPITIEPPPPVLPPETIDPPPPTTPLEGDCVLGGIRIQVFDTGEPRAVDLVPCGESTYDWWFTAPWILAADDAGPFVPLYRADPSDELAAIAWQNQTALIAQDAIDADVDGDPVAIDADRELANVLLDAALAVALTIVSAGV
jgi:hypothetical protein